MLSIDYLQLFVVCVHFPGRSYSRTFEFLGDGERLAVGTDGQHRRQDLSPWP